jgi:hypothetical protein
MKVRTRLIDGFFESAGTATPEKNISRMVFGMVEEFAGTYHARKKNEHHLF